MRAFRQALTFKTWQSFTVLQATQSSSKVTSSLVPKRSYKNEIHVETDAPKSDKRHSEYSLYYWGQRLGLILVSFCVGKVAYESNILPNFLPYVTAKSLLEDPQEVDERNKEYKHYLEEKNTKEIERLNLRSKFNFIAEVVQRTAPAVVYIEIKDRRRIDFYGQPLTASNGSGFIVKEDGLILTNAHVVIGRPHSQVQVKLHDGRIFTGNVEHVDLKSDLATVRIPCTGLATLKLGTSTSVRPGEWVVAMGSPLSLANTITTGVVSSVNRGSSELGLHGKDMEYIQTDAAITFGNSGGPLVNLDGEAIGINAMKVTAGISFAIPVDYAKVFLLATQKDHIPSGYEPPKRRYMGVTLLTLTPQLILELQRRGNDLAPDVVYGVLIWRVALSSPADNAGLQPGDVITMINDKPIHSSADVYKLLESNEELRLQIVRKREHLKLTVLPESVS